MKYLTYFMRAHFLLRHVKLYLKNKKLNYSSKIFFGGGSILTDIVNVYIFLNPIKNSNDIVRLKKFRYKNKNSFFILVSPCINYKFLFSNQIELLGIIDLERSVDPKDLKKIMTNYLDFIL